MLRTGRLLMRRITESDGEGLFGICADDQVTGQPHGTPSPAIAQVAARSGRAHTICGTSRSPTATLCPTAAFNLRLSPQAIGDHPVAVSMPGNTPTTRSLRVEVTGSADGWRAVRYAGVMRYSDGGGL